MTRARKNGIIVNLNWDDILNVPSDLGADQVTYENLAGNEVMQEMWKTAFSSLELIKVVSIYP